MEEKAQPHYTMKIIARHTANLFQSQMSNFFFLQLNYIIIHTHIQEKLSLLYKHMVYTVPSHTLCRFCTVL